MKRTKEQWLALFAEQAQSGLTQTAFAKRQGIIPTYFNLRKRQLLAHQNDDTGFIGHCFKFVDRQSSRAFLHYIF